MTISPFHTDVVNEFGSSDRFEIPRGNDIAVNCILFCSKAFITDTHCLIQGAERLPRQQHIIYHNLGYLIAYE